MSGTHEGGVRAMQTNRTRYGHNFPEQIGRKGGKISRGGGFAAMAPELVKEYGRRGGAASRRSNDNAIPCADCTGMFKTEVTLANHRRKFHTVSYTHEQKSWIKRVFGR